MTLRDSYDGIYNEHYLNPGAIMLKYPLTMYSTKIRTHFTFTSLRCKMTCVSREQPPPLRKLKFERACCKIRTHSKGYERYQGLHQGLHQVAVSNGGRHNT